MNYKFLKSAGLVLAMVAAAASCNKLMTSGQSGTIRVCFADGVLYTSRSSLPDTNEFILDVRDSKGNSIYHGKFGSAPENIVANPGTYSVSACSREFDEPLYDAPQYGDSKTVVVSPGKTSYVLLECSLLNCGIRIHPDWNFLSEYPGGELYLKCAEGRLMYAYNERRTAYFRPGTVAISLSCGGEERLLCTRELEARDILQLKLSAVVSGSTSAGVDIQLDTTSNQIPDSYVIPSSGQTNDLGSAYSVPEARNHVGEDEVWVYGYIVGGDLSSSKCSFTPPFTSRTNLVVASKSSCTDKSACLSVQLSSGDVRDALNLVDHPENLGRQIFVKGEIVGSYYGITGVQNIKEWQWRLSEP